MQIYLDSLKKEFGKKTAVDELTLKIPDGELVCFLGPSGCGKTTILNMLSGILEQTSGSIYFDDQKMDDVKPEKRNIGMVFQNYALYPHMTVYDNIAFPLKMMKISTNDMDHKVKDIAELLEIEDLLKRKPGELSGGEQQRVAIGRALIKNPSVLLMDEPLSNLDKKLRMQTRAEIKNLQQDLKITTIFVTHDQEEAAAISDKILLLNHGKLQQYDTPYELYHNPVNLFVAQFIGTVPINTYKGSIKSGTLTIEKINTTFNTVLPDQDFIYIAIRPEEIEVTEKQTSLKATIKLIENLGKDSIITASLDDEEIRFYVSDEKEFVIGQSVYLTMDRDSFLFFNKDGERIWKES